MKDVPQILVERLARGELSPAEAANVRAALGDEADARLAALAEDDAATIARLPPSTVAKNVARRLAAANPPRTESVPRWWVPLGTAAVAALAVLWLGRSPQQVAPPRGDEGLRDPFGEGPDVVRIKGDAVLTIDRQSARGPERLGDDAMARAGDRLQLQYRAAGATDGVIVSIDGRAGVTLHHPTDGSGATTLAGGGLVALDHSYELDDAPDFERFFFVTASKPIDVARIMAAAQALAGRADASSGALEVPADHAVFAVRLRKPARE